MCNDEKKAEISKYISDAESIFRAQNGDSEALEEIVSSNLGLVKSIAKRFIGRGCEFEDLVQIGSMGMIKAINNFDASKECKFTTYAVPLIIGEIKKFLRDDNWIKVSRETKKNAVNIFKYSEKYEKINGREPNLDEICSELNIGKEDAIFALDSARPQISLYEKDEETGFSPENMIGTDTISAKINLIALHEVIDKLDKEEKMLISLRYFKSLTQNETAKIMNIGQVKVSRLERKILEKLKLMLSA